MEGEKMKLWTLILGVVGIAYLLNIGFGIVEIIPDNAPLIGNLDEFVASVMVFPMLKEFKILK
jgi:hypothetical protein